MVLLLLPGSCYVQAHPSQHSKSEQDEFEISDTCTLALTKNGSSSFSGSSPQATLSLSSFITEADAFFLLLSSFLTKLIPDWSFTIL